MTQFLTLLKLEFLNRAPKIRVKGHIFSKILKYLITILGIVAVGGALLYVFNSLISVCVEVDLSQEFIVYYLHPCEHTEGKPHEHHNAHEHQRNRYPDVHSRDNEMYQRCNQRVYKACEQPRMAAEQRAHKEKGRHVEQILQDKPYTQKVSRLHARGCKRCV